MRAITEDEARVLVAEHGVDYTTKMGTTLRAWFGPGEPFRLTTLNGYVDGEATDGLAVLDGGVLVFLVTPVSRATWPPSPDQVRTEGSPQ